MIKKYINLFYKYLKKIVDPLYVLDELREREGIIVLHISDTPDIIYSFLFSVIDRLKPDYIVHTGDLVDNVKLACGGSKMAYKKNLQRFFSELEKRDWAEKYIIPGNHDSIEFIEELACKGTYIKEEGFILDIKGINIGLAHYKEGLPENTAFSLYGHNKSIINNPRIVALNGLTNLNIILLPDQEIFRLSYPARTDYGRQYKRLKLP